MPVVSYQTYIMTQTHTMLDPGEYSGATDSDGKRCGQGKCTWSDGSSYEGEWKHGFRHGKGVFNSREGTRYDGEWINDIRHGVGDLFYTKSGNRIKGTWENDRLNGEATIINKGKNPVAAVFKMDLAITQHDQGRMGTYGYVFCSIILMLGIYIFAVLIVTLGLAQDMYAVCVGLYIVYIIMSC